MNNFNKTMLEKRLPAFSVLIVLLITMGLTIFLSRNTLLFVTKATVGSIPKNIQISNVTNTSFTVSYLTDQTAAGTIAFGKDPSLGSITLDDRDQKEGKTNEHRVHFMTVQNLQPGTRYYFTVTSGTQIVNDNGKPYEVMTAVIGNPSGEQKNLTGSVALDDGSIPTEGLVYLSTDTSQQLATYLKPDGTYTFSLSQLRTKDLAKFLPLALSSELQLTVQTPTANSKATILVSADNHVPKIVLSQNYDFTMQPADAVDNPFASGSGEIASGSALPASGSGFPIFEDKTPVTSPTITTPTEAQAFKDTQPTFKGKALANAEIELTIQAGKEISAKLQSDADGNWQFRPPVALDPGNHTMTISSMDTSGVLQKITRSFSINASGSQFIEPSVSPIDTPAPTEVVPTASATPTLLPTPTTASATPTLLPTRGPLKSTGSESTTMGIITSMLFLSSGVILFFLISI